MCGDCNWPIEDRTFGSWIKVTEHRAPSMVTVLLCIERNGKRDVTCGWDEADTPECGACWCSCDPAIDLDDYNVVAWMPLPEPMEQE